MAGGPNETEMPSETCALAGAGAVPMNSMQATASVPRMLIRRIIVICVPL
jgi:hypothetical protein